MKLRKGALALGALLGFTVLAALPVGCNSSTTDDDDGASGGTAGAPSGDNGDGEGGTPAGLDTGDGPPKPGLPAVTPVVETKPVRGFGDAADDPAIWVNPSDPEKSLVFGTDKTSGGGLVVYNLDGTEREFFKLGELNNVDLRDGFELAGREVTLIVATNRTNDTLSVLALDPETLDIEDVAGDSITTVPESYGTCLYKNPDGQLFVYVNSATGVFKQYELVADGDQVTAEEVREFCVETQPEGCVADDAHERLFVGEEGFGLWVFPAEEDSPSVGDEEPNCDSAIPGTLVASTFDGILERDVEGMAIYETDDDAGYVIVSAQGEHEFVVFDREPPFTHVTTFAVWGGGASCIDGVEETDGLAVTSKNLGSRFPQGLLVVQDGFNGDPVSTQNFKFVDMRDVLAFIDDPETPFEQNLDCHLGDYGGKARYAGLPPGPERTEEFCATFCNKCDACYEEGDPGFAEGDCHYKSPKPVYVHDDCLAGCAAGAVPADTRPLTEGWEDWQCLDLDDAL